MPSCCFKECDADKENKEPPLTLYRFPVTEDLRQKWIEIIGMENINPRRKMWYVCPRHFNQRTFCRTLGVTRLRDFAGHLPSRILEKDMANYCKYKMGFSQKILMVDGAVPSKFHCPEDRANNIINVRKDLNTDSTKKFVHKSWEHLHQNPEVDGIETLAMIPETGYDAASIGGHPCDEYKREQEKEALQTNKDYAMETIQFSYSSSTDSAKSEADVYNLKTPRRQLTSLKSKNEPSTSKTFDLIQNSELDTVKELDLDEELGSVISNLGLQRRIRKPLTENTENLPEIRRQEDIIEQHKYDPIIASVYNFMKQEYEVLKRLWKIKYDVSCLSNILQRTAAATNVSTQTVTNALQTQKINMAINFDHIYEREYSRSNSVLRKAMLASNARRFGRRGRKNKRLLNKQEDDESDGVRPPKRRLTSSSVGSTSSDENQLPLNAVYSYDTQRTIDINQTNNNNITNYNYGTNNNYGINNNEEDDGIDREWLTPPKEMKTKNIFRNTASDDQQVPFPSPIQFRLPGIKAIECKSELADEYPLMLEVEPLETESSSIALEEPAYPPDAAQFEVKSKPADEVSSSTALEVLSDPPEGAQVEVKLEHVDEDADMCTDYLVCDPTPLDIKPKPPSE